MSDVEGVGPQSETAVNERGGKASKVPYRFDLLPARALHVVAGILGAGAAKYQPNASQYDDNWMYSSVEEHLNHALGHGYAYLAGDRQDDHLGHMACRSLFALAVSLMGGPRSH